MILRKLDVTSNRASIDKLAPKWYSSFKVKSELPSAYFKIVNMILLNGLLYNPSLLIPYILGVNVYHKGLNNKRDKVSYPSK